MRLCLNNSYDSGAAVGQKLGVFSRKAFLAISQITGIAILAPVFYAVGVFNGIRGCGRIV